MIPPIEKWDRPGVHPADLGFRRVYLSENRGQAQDWVKADGNGGRLHAWIYPNGEIVLHRDEIDPSAGPLAAVKHFALETRIGQVAILAGAFVAIFLMIRQR